MEHMENGGIRIDTFEYKGKEIVQTDTFIMTEAFINKITSVLTENEKKLAMALQSYMANQCAEQGNETSMTLYGYKKFGEKDYFPISSNPDGVSQNKADKNVSTISKNFGKAIHKRKTIRTIGPMKFLLSSAV